MFPMAQVVSPSLQHQPRQDVEMLSRLIEDEGITAVVGSSLGGFYALALACRHDLRVCLINPSLFPFQSLVGTVGTVQNQVTGEGFKWTQESVEALRNIYSSDLGQYRFERNEIDWEGSLLLLALDDTRLDHRVALEVLSNMPCVVVSSGGHRMEGFSRFRGALAKLFDIPVNGHSPRGRYVSPSVLRDNA